MFRLHLHVLTTYFNPIGASGQQARYAVHMARALVLVALIAIACGEGEARLPTDDVAAGEVVSLTGVVTARGHGAGRTLAVGDKVFGNEEFVIGSQATIDVRLFHNGALWTATGPRTTQLKQTLAWRAPKSAGGGALAKGHEANTIAGGREAERQVGDTQSTAVLVAETTKADSPPKRRRRPAKKSERKPRPTGARKGGGSQSGALVGSGGASASDHERLAPTEKLHSPRIERSGNGARNAKSNTMSAGRRKQAHTEIRALVRRCAAGVATKSTRRAKVVANVSASGVIRIVSVSDGLPEAVRVCLTKSSGHAIANWKSDRGYRVAVPVVLQPPAPATRD